MKNYSIIRDGEYERLRGIIVDGSILDLGGNLSSEYHSLISGNHTIKSVNMSSEYESDMVFDIQNKFPISNEKFDAVLCMNVLEHVYFFDNVVSETYRVLKKEGIFILAVPFMHHIHSNPDDYFRYSRSAIEKMLSYNNFKVTRIEEIGYGLFSLIYQSSFGVFPEFLRNFLKNIFILVDITLLCLFGRYRNVSKRIPLGYFVIAKKN